MRDAILECLLDERPVTFTGTLEADLIRLRFYIRQTGKAFIKAFLG